MDVEKTMQFLLEQQAASAARMGEIDERLNRVSERLDGVSERLDTVSQQLVQLAGVVKELAVNQVALGKAQVRQDQAQAQLQRTVDTVLAKMDRWLDSRGQSNGRPGPS